MNAILPALGCAVGKIAYEEALRRVLGLAPAPFAAVTIETARCAGRVLATDVVARIDLPGFDQAAMDGYAIDASQVAGDAPLSVTGRTAAGDAPGWLATRDAWRIFTGAPMPSGADTVVMQEDVRVAGGHLTLDALPSRGANVRRRGEDVRAGDALIPSGTTLDWRHQTMLAAQGIRVVAVRRAVRVAVLSGGNELCAATHLAPGRVHDSNLPMLVGLLTAWGADVRMTVRIPDDPAAMRSAFERIAAGADLVVSTGGISVGEEDHTRDALHAAGGRATVLQVAMKPGKPLAVGRLGGAVFVGLPGNPQAALAGAVGFLSPLLARMGGTTPAPPRFARIRSALRRRPGRTEFVPVRLRAPDGILWAEVLGPCGSGRLRPILSADGLAVLHAERGDVAEGDIVPVITLPVAAHVATHR